MAKGVKRCPSCGVNVGPRTKCCPDCKYIFAFKDKETVAQQPSLPQLNPDGTPKKRGRGRPRKGEIVEKKAEQVKVNPETMIKEENKNIIGAGTSYPLIFVPSHSKYDPRPFCPLPLTSQNREAVLTWLDDMKGFIVKDHANQPCKYSRSAIKYFVREFFNINSKEYKTVIKLINDNMQPYAHEIEEGYN